MVSFAPTRRLPIHLNELVARRHWLRVQYESVDTGRFHDIPSITRRFLHAIHLSNQPVSVIEGGTDKANPGTRE